MRCRNSHVWRVASPRSVRHSLISCSVCLHAQLRSVFRRVGIMFEAESQYRKMVVGHSHMQLEVSRPGCPSFELYIVAPFPHCSRPEADFLYALQCFEEGVAPYLASGWCRWGISITLWSGTHLAGLSCWRAVWSDWHWWCTPRIQRRCGLERRRRLDHIAVN